MARASELGMTHLAITDHGTLSGHREHQRAATAAGITPLLGMEAYISETDRFDRRTAAKREDGTQVYNHLGIIARNENGLRNLNAMSREAWQTGFYHKPRIDMELLEEYSDDLIVTSGCLNGLMCKALEKEDYDRALDYAKDFKRIFGERFFIEIQTHNPDKINAGLMKITDELGVLPIVASDCHHARKEDLWVQEAMLIIGTNPTPIKDFDFSKSQKMEMVERFNYLYPDRRMTFRDFGLHLNSYQEHMEGLAKQGIDEQPIKNTMVLADMIEDYPYYKGLDVLPKPEIRGKSEDEALRELVYEGMRERGHDKNKERIDAVEYELGVIENKGFSSYFLIEKELVSFAKDNNILVGPGRGSAVSSLVNFYLGITGFDPKPYNLQFFRFLDPDRSDWPDIDTDFEVNRRHEIKEFANRKYKNTANIATFGFFKGNSSIRDAARVFKIPLGEVNKMLKGISEFEQYKTSESTAEFRKKYPEVEQLAEKLQGRIRSIGMHAGGLVISSRPIEDFVPMMTANDPQDDAADRVSVVGYDMIDVAEIGMIKFDILGLKCLTVIKSTLEQIRERHGVDIDPYDIDLEDPAVYEMLSQGFTKGVFQAEAGPYTKMILKMGGVHTFNELVASNALVRPGAANSSIGENYIKGKATGEFEYIHADAKPFTYDTYGQILFQEQQMLLCTEVAGMSMGEANKVRKAIGKKIHEDLIKFKPMFVEGMAKKVGEKKAEQVWDDLEKSAEYAFNKAHSVGYSMLSYWTAWFKVHYPLEFMNAILKYETNKDSRLDYLMEAKRMGIKILLPHVNASGVNNEIEGDGIRLGLSSVKYISDKVGNKIIDNAPFENYEHLLKVSKTKGSGINSRAVDSLNRVGGAAFEDNPRTGNERENFFEYLDIPAFDSAQLDPFIKAQFRPLDEFTEDEAFITSAMVRGIKIGPTWALLDLVDESGTASVFTEPDTKIEKGRMYVMLVADNRVAQFVTTDDIIEGKGGTLGKFLEKESLELKDDEYRCLSYKTRITKRGSKMANAVFTDGEKNLIPAMIFEGKLRKAEIPCVTAAKMKLQLAETRNGGIFVREIK